MARFVLETHPQVLSFSPNATVALDLANAFGFTITQLLLHLQLNVSTGASVSSNDDLWDRLISRLTLTQQGNTLADIQPVRVFQHISRFLGYGMRRVGGLAASQTNVIVDVPYILHFGVAPVVPRGAGVVVNNPFDLTAGIPPTTTGNLVLQISFADATALGSGYTINSGTVRLYAWGIRPDPQDGPQAYLPMALPVWTTQQVNLTSTSAAYNQTINVPAGDFLHSLLVMAEDSAGNNSSTQLNSIRVYLQKEGRPVISLGDGVGGAIASQWTQVGPIGWPVYDVGGQINIAVSHDAGDYFFPLDLFGASGHPLYGADLRGIATGDLQINYGVATAGGKLTVIYMKYRPLR